MRNLPLRKFVLSALLFIAFYSSLFAQAAIDSTRKPGIFDMLSHKELVEISLMTDMDSLLKNIKTNDYIDGTFGYEAANGSKQNVPVKIRSRGRFRRMKCSFPPLKLKFRKDDLKPHGLNKFNELKLVTHCLDKKDIGKKLILREYLVYKLYNEVTRFSLRAQLVKVDYVNNTGRKPKSSKGWGILIEDSEDLADRMGGKITDRMGISYDSIHAEQEKIASMFQYMIGNTDWNYRMCRNLEYVFLKEGTFVPIPYDFDFSGVVSAPYARPDVKYGQKTMKDRYFLGNAKSIDKLKDCAAHFLSKKKALLAIVDDFKLLDMESRIEIRTFLEEFFQLLESDEKLEAALFKKEDLTPQSTND